MKFLCVSCNTQMKLVKTDKAADPDAKGSLSLRFECPECLTEIAMLTNSFETQLVSSLGVEIGGRTVPKSPGDTEVREEAAAGSEAPATGKCPFSQTARDAMMAGSGLAGNGSPGPKTVEDTITWTAQARVRLQNIPEFARTMAKMGIEKFALENGYEQVTEKCLDEAKEEFGM